MDRRRLLEVHQAVKDDFDQGRYRELTIASRPVLSEISAELRNLQKGKVDADQISRLCEFLVIFARTQCRMEEFDDALETMDLARQILDTARELPLYEPLLLGLDLEAIVLELSRGSVDKDFAVDKENCLAKLKHIVDGLKAEREKKKNTIAASNRLALDRLLVKALCHLGMLYLDLSELELSGRYLRQSLGLSRREFGESDRSSYFPLLGLARLHEREGKPALAAALSKQAYELVLPGTVENEKLHALVVEPLLIRSRALLAQGLPSQALQTARQTVYQALNCLGDEHSLFPFCLAVRARASFETYQESEAVNDYGHLLEMKEHSLAREARHKGEPPANHLLIEPLCDLAQAHARAGDNAAASACLERALDYFEKAPFKQDDALFSSTCYKEARMLDELSYAYLMQGKLADAVRLLPATLRSDYTIRVDRITSIVDGLYKMVTKNAKS